MTENEELQWEVQMALTVLHGRNYETVREASETTNKGQASEKKVTVYSLAKPTVGETVDLTLTEAFGQQTALMQWKRNPMSSSPVRVLEETPGDFLKRTTGSGPAPSAF